MSYIYDEDMTLDEAMEYVNRCSARQAEDTKAFLEILKLATGVEEESAYVSHVTAEERFNIKATYALIALTRIAGICKERLNQ